MTLKNNRAPLLCHFKLCASFCSNLWIQTGVTVHQNWGFFKSCDFAIWQMISKKYMATLLFCHFKLCALFRISSIQTGITVWKKQNWDIFFFFTSVTVTPVLCPYRDPSPLPLTFAWASFLSMLITPPNILMIRWSELWEKGVTDRHIAWSKLKSKFCISTGIKFWSSVSYQDIWWQYIISKQILTILIRTKMHYKGLLWWMTPCLYNERF